MEKIRWGVIGTANIAKKQLIPAITRARNAEVTAVATGSDIEKAEQVAEQFEMEKAYDSYEKLLDDPDIDAVYIPLPNHLHKEWTIKAAEKGKHILCEKPLGLTMDEAEQMKKAADMNNVLLMEAFMYYFHPQHERVKEIITSGEIGEVKYMRASHSFLMPEDKRKTNIRADKDKGGGSIYDVGCYGIHAIRNVLEDEPESVFVHGTKDENHGIESTSIGYFTFTDGKKAVMESSFDMTNKNEYEIIGTKGKILVPRAFRPDVQGGEGLIHVTIGDTVRTESVQGDQYRFEVEHLSEAIFNKDETVVHTLENTMDNMRVIDACYRSIAENRTVDC
ncbi:Gfo/Idh/MocA family protein [Salimicrobium halophilum]|uniref:Predicted dehydrogenase n=1 Tax=Salimicrobium halophilum TaxID=86666 RepID=A0A1G8S536_9BACI|nr:Gfo/Idh/MocA family oxidoreductase [Salimicrobium halophilum]SDJ23760.1 Predicted dehydrogenase [Salimicrobium halophilum]